jgi:hypothetical protein
LPHGTLVIVLSVSTVCIGSGGGGWFTVTVNDSVPVLPASSVALHSTSVSPIENTEPEDGSQEIVILPPMSSFVYGSEQMA